MHLFTNYVNQHDSSYPAFISITFGQNSLDLLSTCTTNKFLRVVPVQDEDS